MYGSLATMQALNGLNNAMQLERNRIAQAKNIDTQTQNMLSQQTENIFMPNIQLYDEAPIYGNAAAAAMGGTISGLLQIGSGIAGGLTAYGQGSGIGLTGSSTPNTGGAGSTTSSGIYGGGGYIPTSNSAPLGIGPH